MNPKLLKKQNCWEVMTCGREPGGIKTHELGICPAATAEGLDRINGGQNGGRICWAIAGTFCDGHVQGSYAVKILTCIKCPFFERVKQEEGVFNFNFTLEGKEGKN